MPPLVATAIVGTGSPVDLSIGAFGRTIASTSLMYLSITPGTVSYTHLRAHET